jgi:hypothetical protein
MRQDITTDDNNGSYIRSGYLDLSLHREHSRTFQEHNRLSESVTIKLQCISK